MLQNFHCHVVPTRKHKNSHVTEFSLSRCPHSKPPKQPCYRVFTLMLSPLETPKTAMLQSFHCHVVPNRNHKNSHVTEFLLSPCPYSKPSKQPCYRIFTLTLFPLETPKTVMLRNFHSHVVSIGNPKNSHVTEFLLLLCLHSKPPKE